MVDAEIPNAASPNVLPVNAPNVIVCDVRLILNDDDVTDARPGAENVKVKLPPAPFTFRPLKVATPDDAEMKSLPKLAKDEPEAIVAVTVGAVETTFPPESTTFTTGCVPNAAPIATPPTGCVVIDSAAAAPTVRLKFDDVAEVNPDAAKVKVWFVGAINPVSVAAVNVATPDDVVAVSVPPIVPVADDTVTIVAGCVVTALPPASTTVTAGEPVTTPPDAPPVGCVDTFSAEAAPHGQRETAARRRWIARC